ncbi:hypothetical protein KTQ42_09610|uniref:hypothetical protein n=1 Tax=Noviherbaspirillum sp. L7-7A TaxID=2850560 RepID=UPI001C2C8DEF|nr:hypothetical protein [Noviherbaspirillum sp. L7-7A]MBV0879556.1 hypothetical protein [Noviherbaspirillum sp. L7-7A]
MNVHEQFNQLVQLLAKQWDIEAATAPLEEATVRFVGNDGSTVILRLHADNKRCILGIERPLTIQGNVALDEYAMSIFMLQRNYTMRLGSQTCFSRVDTNGRMAAFQSVPLNQANCGDIPAALARLSARLGALMDSATIFARAETTTRAVSALEAGLYV